MPATRSTHRSQVQSLWQLLYLQLGGGRTRGEELLAERNAQQVTGFLRTPWHLEKLLYFGILMCLDSFLFIFTFLPLRILLAIPQLVFNSVLGRRPRLSAAQQCDLCRGGVVVIVCLLLQVIDASRLYHLIRNQDTIKLYVVFNVLEIFDRYCSWLGQDVLGALLSHHHAHHMFLLAVAYVLIHSLINFCQVMTLNVAINAHSRSLLTMLVSNQFVELKGNVFKKFGREQIEKIAGADAVERFNIGVWLIIISIRNLGEIGWSVGRLRAQAWVFLSVLGSEVFVDWLKHAFLSRFNGFGWDLYDTMNIDLAKDVMLGHALDVTVVPQQQRKFLDQPHLVTRKLGFVSLPLACLLVRVLVQSLPRPSWNRKGLYVGLVLWLTLAALKVLVNILMLGRAANLAACATVSTPHITSSARRTSEREQKSWAARTANQAVLAGDASRASRPFAFDDHGPLASAPAATPGRVGGSMSTAVYHRLGSSQAERKLGLTHSLPGGKSTCIVRTCSSPWPSSPLLMHTESDVAGRAPRGTLAKAVCPPNHSGPQPLEGAASVPCNPCASLHEDLWLVEPVPIPVLATAPATMGRASSTDDAGQAGDS